MNRIVGIVVATVALLNILALVWLLWGMRRRRGEPMAETTGHVWDDDLRELNNPLPRWWLGLFLITVVFGLIYLALFPGLGNYRGTLQWSSHDQWRAQMRSTEAQLARTFAPFEHQSVETLAGNADAVRIGRNLFLNNCAACHGSDGRGAPGFPDLTDRKWLWGGTPADILRTISDGRMGVMPAWRAALGGDAGVEDVLAYVLSLSGRHVPAGDVTSGQQKFLTICIACHGADGHGNPLLGAPSLTDGVWLFGGAVDTVRSTIAEGRQSQMPAFRDRLGETRVKLLAAYVVSLGGAVRAAPTSAAAAPTVPAAVARANVPAGTPGLASTGR